MSYNSSSNGIQLGLSGATSGKVSQFASAATTSYSIFWPSAQAAGVNYVLANDGNGNLSWIPNSMGMVTAVNASGAVSSSGGASPNITLNANGVTYSYLAQMVANTIKGNNT